ncbi:MAG: hypothetical protein D4R97_02745 [Bacteroidetes bacterium]|nr:MAG: hypothetical protein D4R97_02745 [Bacteroidota bacterium]
METHAHHLHHAPGKKSWHYFYEFLMLFLAVFCGFLAENLREKNVEHNREKEFMKSLIEDLQLDTAQFSSIKLFRLARLSKMDSIIIFFQYHSAGPVPAYGYVLANKLLGHAGFFQNSGTLDQLKNSGGFRLIRHRNVVEAIESYDQQIKRIALRDLYETDFTFDHNKLLQKLFDGRALLKLFTDTNYIKKPASPSFTIKLNEQYLGEYLNSLRTFQSLVRIDMDLQARVKEKATLLITVIKKEYQLE